MNPLDDTHAVFEQLSRASDGGLAVRNIIENHESSMQGDAVEKALTAAVRLRLARLPRDARVAAQAQRLENLVVLIPRRRSTAV
jgi:hypothetical protein